MENHLKFDERSGAYVSQGQYYGVGKKQPVGSKDTKQSDRVPKSNYKKYLGEGDMNYEEKY